MKHPKPVLAGAAAVASIPYLVTRLMDDEKNLGSNYKYISPSTEAALMPFIGGGAGGTLSAISLRGMGMGVSPFAAGAAGGVLGTLIPSLAVSIALKRLENNYLESQKPLNRLMRLITSDK